MTGKLGKRGVVVRDAPGFVVNRLLTRQSSVLMQAVEHGNTFEQTDEAALKLGIPMPPSALLALVGPRVANHVLHTLHDAYPDRFPLSPALDSLAAGEMDIVVTTPAPRTVDEIHLAVLEALADECRHVLDEGVVGTAARDRRVHDPRRRLPVLPRRDHEAPRPDRRLGASLGPPPRRSLEKLRNVRQLPLQSGAQQSLVAPETRERADPSRTQDQEQHHPRVLHTCKKRH